MKKLLCFDGDGTLWYPRSTRRRTVPYWIYEATLDDPLAELVATPTAIHTLKLLKKQDIQCVLVSTSPLSPAAALASRVDAAQRVGVFDWLDEIRVSPHTVEGKGQTILSLLEEYGLQPEDALMVGDSLNWDYRSARAVGVDALLIDAEYHAAYRDVLPREHLIQEVGDVLRFL